MSFFQIQSIFNIFNISGTLTGTFIFITTLNEYSESKKEKENESANQQASFLQSDNIMYTCKGSVQTVEKKFLSQDKKLVLVTKKGRRKPPKEKETIERNERTKEMLQRRHLLYNMLQKEQYHNQSKDIYKKNQLLWMVYKLRSYNQYNKLHCSEHYHNNPESPYIMKQYSILKQRMVLNPEYQHHRSLV
jgi:hypothetical protein